MFIDLDHIKVGFYSAQYYTNPSSNSNYSRTCTRLPTTLLLIPYNGMGLFQIFFDHSSFTTLNEEA